MQLLSHSFVRITVSAAIVLASVLGSEEVPATTVTISPGQYCYGCKTLVLAYMTTISDELTKMKKQNIQNGAVVDAAALAKNICDSAFFDMYEEYIRHSCIKIMHEHYLQFIKKFEGLGSPELIYGTGSLYRKTKEVFPD